MVSAVVHFGLSIDEFWDLSWYEWSLYTERFEVKTRAENNIIEHQWQMTRIMWATIMNRWRSQGERTYRPEDLIRLSFDEVIITSDPNESPEDKLKKFGKSFKRDAS